MSVFFALIAAVSAASATDEPLFTLPMDFPDGTRAALRVHRDSQPHLLVVEFCQRYGCRGDDLNLLVGEVHARYVKHTGACPTGLRVPLPADRAAGTALRPSAHCVCDTARAFQLRQDGLGCDALSCVGPVCSADWHFQHEGAAARRAAGHDTLNFTSPNAGAAGARHAQDDGVELVDASQLPQQQADWQRRGIILVVLGVVFVFFAALARLVIAEIRRLQALPEPSWRALRRAQVREAFRALYRNNFGRGGAARSGKGGNPAGGTISNRAGKPLVRKNMHGKRRSRRA